ncbi:hypothetical protein [Streptomyces sp. OfavH-34-F]|uniref:hypothetical protein n=1 Tax=Streptomyces sp. OfavH-34-F TaxID=2917760 RepID=UPI0027E48D81|nr:hypothetical protein [Streptomyces sp. OfavH-34-F]
MNARRTARRHPAAGRRRIWLLAIPIALILALFGALAWADPAPTPAPGPAPSAPGSTPTSKPTPTPKPKPTKPNPITEPRPGLTPAPPDGKPVKDLSTSPADGSNGLLQPFNVKDQYGVPISAYTINADTGGWTDIDLKIWDILAQLFFGVAKWFIGFACWLIKWALDFGLAKIFVGPVDDIATTIRDQMINRMGLPGLFLLFAGVYAGWHIMFKQKSRGFAEAGVSLVVAAIATTVLLSPAQVLLGTQDQPGPGGSTMLLSKEGLLGKAKDLSLQVSSLVLSDDPNHIQARTSNVSKPIKDALVDAFIVKPTQLMLYGQVFDGQCAKAFAKAKLVEYNYKQNGINFWEGSRANPGGASYNDQLLNAGDLFTKTCEGQKTKIQAKKASADLTFSALFVAIAAIIVSVLVVLVTGGFLTAQGWIAFEAIRGHWALCAGILPGGGRSVLWRWVAAITKAVLAVVLSILFLSIFILIIIALVRADTGSVLAVKFIAIDITAIAGLAGHKKIKETARQISVNLNRRLANARVGGSRQSVFSRPGRYAETAPGLKQVWGEARGEARKVTQPLGKAGRTARQLWTGPPQGGKKGGRVRSAAKLATNVAAAVGTGGTATAAKIAAQNVAKQTLKKRLATAAANKMSQSRGGRATMATGKVAAAAGKYGWKATKFTALATVGAPVGIPRGVAVTKRGATFAKARASEVKGQLTAVRSRATARVDKKVGEAKAFKDEYVRNVATAGKFVGRHGANVQLGMAQPTAQPKPPTPPGTRAAATAPRVPGTAPRPGSSAPKATPTANPAGPASVPALPHAPTTPTAKPAGSDSGAAPAAPGTSAGSPRRIRRATRPAGPPRPKS